MEKMAEFLTMGGYGSFVWPSYALVVLLLVWLVVQSRRWLRAEERAVRAMEAEAPHRRAVAQGGSAHAEDRR